jgi:hypothetical protein
MISDGQARFRTGGSFPLGHSFSTSLATTQPKRTCIAQHAARANARGPELPLPAGAAQNNPASTPTPMGDSRCTYFLI